MRLVVDTNIFISAVLKEASWPGVVVRWLDRFGGLLKTPATEREVFTVLARPRIAEDILPLHTARVQRIFAAAELVPIITPVSGCRDPKDDKFLELAVNGRADLIVSGDEDLLILDSFQGIPIITPAIFGRAQAL